MGKVSFEYSSRHRKGLLAGLNLTFELTRFHRLQGVAEGLAGHISRLNQIVTAN